MATIFDTQFTEADSPHHHMGCAGTDFMVTSGASVFL
jgi:hypothetical protein